MPGALARRRARTKGPVERKGRRGEWHEGTGLRRGLGEGGEGKGTGGGRGWGGAENRGLLTLSGKWAAATERAGWWRPAFGHVGAATRRKAWGGAVLYSVRILAWLLLVREVFYGQILLLSERTDVEELLVGWGNGCICGCPVGRPEVEEEKQGITHPQTSKCESQSGTMSCQN